MISPVESTLDQCLKCNICTSACPVAAVTDLFPGPKYAGPQSSRFRRPGESTPDVSVDYCSGCRVCNMVCPTGVKIAEMNARARAVIVQQGKVPFRLRLRNNLIARSEMIGKIGQPIALLANYALTLKPARWLAEKMLGIARQAPLPKFSANRFTTWFSSHTPVSQSTRAVVYFHGCSTEYYEPHVGRAAVRVLEKNGFHVIVPRQNCCGLPLLSNGEFPAAQAYHQRNIDNLTEYAAAGIPIVGTSTSCTLTLKEEAPELLDMLDSNTLLVSQQTFDINEFLLSIQSNDELQPGEKPIPLELLYHMPCQYRAHRLGYPALEILRQIPGLNVMSSQSECCGIAGTYGYKIEKFGISMSVGRSLFEQIKAMKTPLVICDSETCRWHISAATGIPCAHPIELLAASYGFEPEGALEKLLTQRN